jgi:Tol biopolymer transport system component
MSAITSRFASSPGVPWRAIAVAALLIALIAGALVVAGSLRQRVPPPFGPAANGTVYFSVNGDLMAADSPTGTPRKILAGDTVDNGPLLSPDGTRMVFVRGLIGGTKAELWTAGSDASTPRKLVATPRIGWAEWSPQSDTIAVLRDDSTSTIFMVDAATGTTHEIDTGLPAVLDVVWRPPDGAQLSFRGRDSNGRWGIYLINRDGSGLKRLELDAGFESDPGYDAKSDGYFAAHTWSADGSMLVYESPEPGAGTSTTDHHRNHVATIDGAGDVSADRVVEFDSTADDEVSPVWLDQHSILYHAIKGSEQRLLVGSVADGTTRDLGVAAHGWMPVVVAPDTKTAIVSVPISGSTVRDIQVVDLANGATTPTELGADDISWQRLAQP